MRWKTVTGIAAVMVTACAPAKGAEAQAADLDQVIAERVQQGLSYGLVVAVVTPDGPQFHAAGSLWAESDTTVNPDTLYEIGSITTVFTALLLADMIQSGEVALDDPIVRYLPEGASAPQHDGKEIRLRDLALHTSTLPRLPVGPSVQTGTDPYENYSLSAMYELVASHQPNDGLGARWSYSHVGYGLLGELLSRKASRSYDALIQSRVCHELRMKSTGSLLSSDDVPRLARGYHSDAEIPNWEPPSLVAAGGLRSTARDLAGFVAAFLGFETTRLQPAMRAMLTVRHPTGEDDTEQALGWQVEKRQGDELFVSHSGRGGYRAWIGFNPKQRRGVVVLSNTAREISDIGLHVLDPRYPLARVASPDTNKPELLDEYVGRYVLAGGMVFAFTRDGNKLMVEQAGVAPVELHPESDVRFAYKVADASFTFDRNAAGVVDRATLHQFGKDQVVRKLDPKREPPIVNIDPRLMDGYVGNYTSDDGLEFVITKEDDQLFLRLNQPGAPRLAIYPTSDTEFVFKLLMAGTSFEANEHGMVNSIVFRPTGGQEIRASRRFAVQIGP